MKIKNIILLSTLHHYDEWSYDAVAYNIYISLKIMGYNVNIFNPFTSKITLSEYENQVGTPDLLFCILSGLEPDSFLEYITTSTREERYITFNMFCDDSWRFTDFSSKVCFCFRACSTPESKALEKYASVGYKNIINLPFLVCEDLYCVEKNIEKNINISTFSRYQTAERLRMKNLLSSQLSPSVFGENESFEKMLITMNKSKIVMNLVQSSKNNKQMKMRIFEAPACGALLMTESYKEIDNYFIENKEYVSFESLEECISKCTWLLRNPNKLSKIAQLGHERWKREHEAKRVLARLMTWMENF